MKKLNNVNITFDSSIWSPQKIILAKEKTEKIFLEHSFHSKKVHSLLRRCLILFFPLKQLLLLPFCSQCHAISETVSLSSLALLLPVLVSYGIKVYIIYIFKKTLSDEFFANPRSLYNSYMAKVSILSGLRNRFLCTEIPFLAYPKILKLHWKRQFSKKNGMPEVVLPSTKIYFWDHLTIDTLATLLL